MQSSVRICSSDFVFFSAVLCQSQYYNRFLITLPGGWAAGGKARAAELAVTPVPRTSSEPVRQMKLDVCALSVSSNSYN